MPSLLYGDALVLCGESEDDLRMMIRHLFEVYKRRSQKVNARNSKVMVFGVDGRIGV